MSFSRDDGGRCLAWRRRWCTLLLLVALFPISSSFQPLPLLQTTTTHQQVSLTTRPWSDPQSCSLLWESPSPSSSSSSSSPSTSPSPFDKASIAFEKAHFEDPRTVEVNGEILPYSVHYHRRTVHHLNQLEPNNAPEAVQLAARCQHIRRWTRPRSDYPKGLAPYKQWRAALKDFHAEQATQILLESGYDQGTADRVSQLLRKEKLSSDPDVQLLEDVVCVVFLENEYTRFVAAQEEKEADGKLVGIVQKTWKKMTPRGHQAALALADQLTERGLAVLQQALAKEEKEE